MAQPHLAPGQLGSVLPLGDKLAQTPSAPSPLAVA